MTVAVVRGTRDVIGGTRDVADACGFLSRPGDRRGYKKYIDTLNRDPQKIVHLLQEYLNKLDPNVEVAT